MEHYQSPQKALSIAGYTILFKTMHPLDKKKVDLKILNIGSVILVLRSIEITPNYVSENLPFLVDSC